jgi:hypothetical protein
MLLQQANPLGVLVVPASFRIDNHAIPADRADLVAVPLQADFQDMYMGVSTHPEASTPNVLRVSALHDLGIYSHRYPRRALEQLIKARHTQDPDIVATLAEVGQSLYGRLEKHSALRAPHSQV